ncbi:MULTISPECIES: CU044_2847 family protein [unclassified Pseudoalteromonas]|uniref:CU044_2847 family protein n=1 Tax=unclassified Pseudoalteromonas TaxID=194690 RepID=UPI0020973940|nr:CU044_2847 family protein [Pseudoalteromonas sp. XMcav2-N]MCO7189487.1 hypothetical protein [Pseudoalteromonas sp. XMcav2-N]
MTTLRFDEGIEFELDTKESGFSDINSQSNSVGTVNKLKNALETVMIPVVNTFKELNKDIAMESAIVEVGMKVTGEGNFIVAKSAMEGHVKVSMTFKACDHENE